MWWRRDSFKFDQETLVQFVRDAVAQSGDGSLGVSSGRDHAFGLDDMLFAEITGVRGIDSLRLYLESSKSVMLSVCASGQGLPEIAEEWSSRDSNTLTHVLIALATNDYSVDERRDYTFDVAGQPVYISGY